MTLVYVLLGSISMALWCIYLRLAKNGQLTRKRVDNSYEGEQLKR